MRTTVDLPDPLFRELKALAARRGLSLKSVIRAAVEDEIRMANRKTGRNVKFPILPSRKPGSLKPSNADLEDLLA
jgi:metal-responsive CopG/Arc/MetJ family transcriptional regulator